MQRVDRHAAVGDLGDDLVARATGERIGLEEAEARIERHERGRAPVCGLVGAQARHPCARAFERAAQRRDLAHLAAGLALRDAIVLAVDPLRLHQRFERGGVRVEGAHLPAVLALRLRPDRIGLGKQPAGVERRHLDLEIIGEDQVGEELVLDAEAGREDDPSVDLRAQQHEARERIATGKSEVERSGRVMHGERLPWCCGEPRTGARECFVS